MTRILYLVLIYLSIPVEGCDPGTGALGTKGSFTFEMIPPVMYTYSSTDLSHGQISQSFASGLLSSDVKNSINEVLQANSIPTNDVTPPTISFTAPDVKIIDGSTCTAENDTILYDSKVYYKCSAALVKQVYTVEVQVEVTAVHAIYESQWSALAQQVQQKLTDKRSAEFVADPVVTVQ